MRERLRIFFYLVLFWMSLMIVARIIFFAYNWDFTASLTAREIMLSMLNGLRMDASITGYFMAASGLLLTLSVFNNHIWISRTLVGLILTLLVFCTVIIGVDLELYRHWGFRMNTTPLLYLGNEAMGSIEVIVMIKVGVLLLSLLATYNYFFIRWIYPRIMYSGEAKLNAALVLLALSVLMFLPIRGSFTVAPMNTGFVFFHNTKPFANHSAINVVWNFLYDLRKVSSADYPEDFFDKQKTESLFKELYEEGNKGERIVHAKNPNIILIILESFTAGVVEPLGGIKGLTPNLNGFCNEGILFTNFYSSGDRTDKGLISILSGFPAQPRTSIIKVPAKTQKLPQLNQYIKALGYQTSFIYGGDVDFASFRSYLNTSGFHHITTLDDFEDSLYTSKWGVHDQYMFDKAAQELDTAKGKFFKVILTLSSHEPFDVPMKPYVKGKNPESQFLNSCHYTDKSLGVFINHCKNQPWWKNTLVIITADHGHRHPGNKELHEKERFRVPLLLMGGVVQKDTIIDRIGGHTDIANTLLGQIGDPSEDFVFSKNLFDFHGMQFASYFFNDGYGFITPESFVVYDNHGKQFIKKDGASEHTLELSKAFQQKLFSIYNTLETK